MAPPYPGEEYTVGDEIQRDANTSALSRRNAIKAAAAVGVGAAAWTGPKIGMFGATPAYAGACSGEVACTAYFSGNTNTGNGCPGNGQDAQFDLLDAEDQFPLSLTVGAATISISATTDSICTGPGSNLQATTSGATAACRIEGDLIETGGNNSTYPLTSAFQTFTPGGSPLVFSLPTLTKDDVGTGSLTYRFRICCTTEKASEAAADCVFP